MVDVDEHMAADEEHTVDVDEHTAAAEEHIEAAEEAVAADIDNMHIQDVNYANAAEEDIEGNIQQRVLH